MQEGNLDTKDPRREKATGDRDWNDAFTSQGTPGIAGNQQMLGERYGTDSFSEPLEGTIPADTWI